MRASFAQRQDGYAGTVDTWLEQADREQAHGGDISLQVGGDSPNGSSLQNQAVIRFDNVVGDSAAQVPASATLTGARLLLRVADPGDPFEVYDLASEWDESSTWATFGTEVSGGTGVVIGTDTQTLPHEPPEELGDGWVAVDVTTTVGSWLLAPDQNFGWAVVPTGPDGIVLDSSESSRPPRLEIDYR